MINCYKDKRKRKQVDIDGEPNELVEEWTYLTIALVETFLLHGASKEELKEVLSGNFNLALKYALEENKEEVENEQRKRSN